MNTKMRSPYMHLLIMLVTLFISGCGDDDSPQNSRIHFTNNTDKEITIKYRQEVADPLTDEVFVKAKEEKIPIGENRKLTIQESIWTVNFTIVYDNVEYDKSISVNFVGGDEDYNVTLQSLGIASNG